MSCYPCCRYRSKKRYNSSSIVPKGQLLRELLDLANDTPFDDRANTSASISDVSQTLVRDFLVKTGSKLAQQIETEPFRNILEAMELLAGPREAIYPRNVALMMFNDHPEKFFPYLQVDITIFPKGKLKDPDNFIEVPPIKGPIDSLYHYDYRKREPITIEIEPDAMYISNPGGPDRSLTPDDFTKSIVHPHLAIPGVLTKLVDKARNIDNVVT